MNYTLAYRIGFHPWEDAEEQPSFIDKFSALLDREESGRQPPYGPALDVGTGSGIWESNWRSAAGGHGHRHRRQGAPARARAGAGSRR